MTAWELQKLSDTLISHQTHLPARIRVHLTQQGQAAGPKERPGPGLREGT